MWRTRHYNQEKNEYTCSCCKYKWKLPDICKECEDEKVIEHWMDAGFKFCPFCTKFLSL